MKQYILFCTGCVLLAVLIGGGLAYGNNALDDLFEPTPEPGQIWLPECEPVQSHWHSIREIEVVEVRGDLIRTQQFGFYDIYERQFFHERFNFARKDSTLTP